MAERKSDRWISMLQSLLLHGAVVGLLVYGWWFYKHRTPAPAAQTLGIEAVALDSNAASQPKKPPPPAPQPEPEPKEPEGPPAPTPEEIAQREEEARKAQEQQAEEKKAAEQKRLA